MRKLAILFLPVFFWGCNAQPKIVPVKFQAEELEVIKQTFHDATCCYLIEMEHRFKSDLNESREAEENRYKIWADSIYGHLQNKLVWYVNDTLYSPKEIGLKVRYYPKIKDDSSLLKLENKLFTAEYPKQAIKLKGLTIGNYLFKSADSIEHLNNISPQKITLSRVVFNSNHTKACYYMAQSIPKNHWADGEMIHVEKRKNKWFVKYRKLYWIT